MKGTDKVPFFFLKFFEEVAFSIPKPNLILSWVMYTGGSGHDKPERFCHIRGGLTAD